MSIIANVKGYFMGGGRGVISNSDLWSYEEIIAATLQEALDELNTNPNGYYNVLLNHLTYDNPYYYLNDTDGQPKNYGKSRFIVYENQSWMDYQDE